MFNYKFFLVIVVLINLLIAQPNQVVAANPPETNQTTLNQVEEVEVAVWPNDGSRIDHHWEHIPNLIAPYLNLRPELAAEALFGTSNGTVKYAVLTALDTSLTVNKDDKIFYIDGISDFESFGGGLASTVDQIDVLYLFFDANQEVWAWRFVLTKSDSGNRLIVPERGGDPQELVLTLKTTPEAIDWNNPEDVKRFISLSLGFPQ